MAVIQWQTINQLHLWTQSVLPATFDDSLSYYEVLAKTVNKLNEVIEIVNAQGEGIETYITQLFDEYKAAWDAETNAKLQALQDNVDSQVNSLTNYVNTEVGSLQQQFSSYTQQSDLKFAAFQNKVNADIAAFQTKVNNDLANMVQSIVDADTANRQWTIGLLEEFKATLPTQLPPIIDPTDGKLEDVQTVVNHLWDALNTNSITAGEYDALELTAEEYDAKQLTARQYDQTGKLLLMPDETKEVSTNGSN